MDRSQIEALLNEVQAKRTSVPDALDRLKDMPFEDLGFAKLDHHRALRTGMPEVIFAAGKTSDQVARIFMHMAKAGGNVLATRASRECFEAVSKSQPGAVYHETARAITLEQAKPPAGQRNHLRGLRRHQRFARRRRSCRDDASHGKYHRADCGRGRRRNPPSAGAEAIASIRARAYCLRRHGRRVADRGRGLVNAPVLAVPTSVGYGASFGGVAALLGMLNTCSPNVSVVNIDNGFGAACIASLINHMD